MQSSTVISGTVACVFETDRNCAFFDETGHCYAWLRGDVSVAAGTVAELSGRIAIDGRNWQKAYVDKAVELRPGEVPPSA